MFYEDSYALVETEEDVPSVFGGASKQECPFCESSYQDIIVLDGTDPRLSFLNADGIIKIKSCLCCLPWSSPIISSYEVNGEGEVISHEDGDEFNYIDDESMNDHDTYILSKHKVPMHFCTEWEGSAIGGKPKFVDDANFAKCPKCGKYMKHIAQYINDNIDEIKDEMLDFKVYVIAGEQFPKRLYDLLREKTDAKIFNVYGPTETTISCNTIELESDDITVGKALFNVHEEIMDLDSNPLPDNVIGELYIAGCGVSREYLNRPEKNKEAYIKRECILM